jgi:putative transposase
MDAEKARFPIRFMAERLGVSTGEFYEWRQRQQSPCQRRVADAGLSEMIVEIWRQSRGTDGSPRVWAEMRLRMNIRIRRKRVARLMRQEGIEGAYRRRSRGCTRPNPWARPPDDLV